MPYFGTLGIGGLDVIQVNESLDHLRYSNIYSGLFRNFTNREWL